MSGQRHQPQPGRAGDGPEQLHSDQMEKHRGDPLGRDAGQGVRLFWRAGGGAGEAVPSVQEERKLPEGAVPFDPALTAPLLGTVRAGLPMYAEENIEGYIPITRKDGARYFWLRVRGDSMNAMGISENDEILVREQPEVENGQLAVVMVNGDEATVKYFRQEGSLVVLTPKSFNPVHQPQIYDLKRVQVRVVGLVVECRKVF